ncbi:EAL domain-containing protein [uncultured Cocleimonas sp.]|uniref:EAL domain-containing protein n=1 Tax=uncultured Cocleimonas sp. TaxID=1051587 RepID=UPI0026200366|nr:EAL domain-containing protein [uncultured Cocleimonas sp.]
MIKGDLQCVLIGQNKPLYSELVSTLRGQEAHFRFKQVDNSKRAIINSLKRLRSASLVFISDDVPFSLESLSDLVWQYASDSIIVILTKKTQSLSLKTPYDNTQISKLHFDKDKKETILQLQFLLQTAFIKSDFRKCKTLLGISEKRCQWLVDSSREAIAFISRDLHLYANRTYLNLFHLDSIQELRSLSVRDFISEDEHRLFDGFQNDQLRKPDLNHSLVLTMKKKNGATFRANTYLIPTVYKSKKCLQFWVRVMGEVEDSNQVNLSDFPESESVPSKDTAIKKKQEKREPPNPFEVLLKNDNEGNSETMNTKQKKIYTPASLLKGIINRKEAVISTSSLKRLKKNELKFDKFDSHYLLSLKVPIAQRKGVDDILQDLSGARSQEVCSIFWDKVKLTRLLQILLKKRNVEPNLIVRLNGVSVADKQFLEWLIPGLRRLGIKSSHITFLVPSQVSEKQAKATIVFANKVRAFNCQIALEGFAVSKDSVQLLKRLHPEMVSLSLPWTRQIQGNENREIGLSSVIRQLESKDIKVIAPCGFSIDMKKLFILSGASFCHESSTKHG